MREVPATHQVFFGRLCLLQDTLELTEGDNQITTSGLSEVPPGAAEPPFWR